MGETIPERVRIKINPEAGIEETFEGQEIGYAEERKAQIGSDLNAKVEKYDAANPLPESEPEIIEVEAKPPFSKRLLNIIKQHSEESSNQ